MSNAKFGINEQSCPLSDKGCMTESVNLSHSLSFPPRPQSISQTFETCEDHDDVLKSKENHISLPPLLSKEESKRLTPFQRLCLFAQGNLQILLRSYLNAQIDVRLVKHQVDIVNDAGREQNHLGDWSHPNHCEGSESMLDDEWNGLISKANTSHVNITRVVDIVTSNQRLLQARSHVQVRPAQLSFAYFGVDKEEATKRLKAFILGKVGIGQLFVQLKTIPNFQLLQYETFEPLDDRRSTNPIGLYRKYQLNIDSVIESCIEESFQTCLFQ